MCKVTGKAEGKITNIADITKYKDENKKDVTDRDSKENNVILPADKDLPSYKDDEKGNYIPGQEDDDEFEKLVVKKFDLALRKFITNISDKDVTTRIPQVKYENSQISYEHTKEPLIVHVNDVVIYTLRIFNEGNIDGYASKKFEALKHYAERVAEVKWGFVRAVGSQIYISNTEWDENVMNNDIWKPIEDIIR